MNRKETTLIAISMNGRGAVELIIASVGIELGIINDVYFSILVVVAFITTLLPPVVMGALLRGRYKITWPFTIISLRPLMPFKLLIWPCYLLTAA